MRTTTLGPGGPLISRIGLGLAALGRPAYITSGRARDLADRSAPAMRARTFCVLDAAYDAGVRYADAARSYGRAEEFLTGWLAERGHADVVVGSKWGYRYTGGWRLDAAQQEVKEHGSGHRAAGAVQPRGAHRRGPPAPGPRGAARRLLGRAGGPPLVLTSQPSRHLSGAHPWRTGIRRSSHPARRFSARGAWPAGFAWRRPGPAARARQTRREAARRARRDPGTTPGTGPAAPGAPAS
jgi:hypothetical protein